MSRMRLLAILEAYSITGPAKNLLEFAQLASKEGVETIIATFTRGAASNVFIETTRGRGLPIEVIEENGIYDRRVLQTLHEITRRLEPDLIQTHAVKSHFLARWADLGREIPWVAFHHGYTWPSPRARLYNQLDRWSLRAARKVLTVSAPFREQLIGRGVAPERIEIVHNAIPADWGCKAREPKTAAAFKAQLGIPPQRKVILIVGRLSREKDHLTLLEAVKRLCPADLHLIIVGEGPERSRIENQVRLLDLAERVTFTGQQNSAEPYYGIADVAVLSSLSEGSPNALLEAMASGVPVVATSVGGIPEIVSDNESALLVRPGDVAGMSAAMERLLMNPDLAGRLMTRSREVIRLRHAPEARMRKLVEIYESCLAGIRVGQGKNN